MNRRTSTSFYRFSNIVANKALLFCFLAGVFFLGFLPCALGQEKQQKINGFEAVHLRTLAEFEAGFQREVSQNLREDLLSAADLYQRLGDPERALVLLDQVSAMAGTGNALDLARLQARALFLSKRKDSAQKIVSISKTATISPSAVPSAIQGQSLDELRYLSVLSYLHLGQGNEALQTARLIPKSSEFFIYAQSALAENFLSKNQLDSVIGVYAQIDDNALSKSSLQSAVYGVSRLNHAKALNAKNQHNQAFAVLDRIPLENPVYPEVLFMRAYLNLQSNRPEKYVESLAFLSRALKNEMPEGLAYQAFLLSAFCYSKLGALNKGGAILQEGLKKLEEDFAENKKLSQDPAYFNEKIDAGLLRLAAEPPNSSGALTHPVFLTSSFKKWLPALFHLRQLRQNNAENIVLLSRMVELLGKDNFDPSLLKNPRVQSLFLSFNEETLQSKRGGSAATVETFQKAKRLYGLLFLAQRYAEYLVEGRKWDVTKQFLVQNAIAGRLKRVNSLKNQKEVIEDYFLGSLKEEPQPVIDLKARIAKVEKSFFLEEKRLQEALSIMNRLKLTEKKLDEIGRYAKIILTEKEIAHYVALRKEVQKQHDQFAQMIGLFESNKATKVWLGVNQTVHEMLNPEDLQNIEKEVDVARAFIEKVQLEDEEVKNEFFSNLGGIQKRLEDQAAILLRTIFLETTRGLLATHQTLQAKITEAENQSKRSLRRDYLAEATETNGKLLHFQSQMRYEIARLSDVKIP